MVILLEKLGNKSLTNWKCVRIYLNEIELSAYFSFCSVPAMVAEELRLYEIAYQILEYIGDKCQPVTSVFLYTSFIIPALEWAFASLGEAYWKILNEYVSYLKSYRIPDIQQEFGEWRIFRSS